MSQVVSQVVGEAVLVIVTMILMFYAGIKWNKGYGAWHGAGGDANGYVQATAISLVVLLIWGVLFYCRV